MDESPMIAFMKECRRMQIPPAPFGLVKRKGKENVINVNHYNIGDSYAKALSSSIKHINPKTLILSSNNNTQGIMNIIHNLNEQCEKLDMSNNFVNSKTISMMCSWMTKGALSGKSKLKYLNLSNNRLKDELLLTL
jgi:hypothetical protein